jgi:hypothetical protein
METKTKDRGHDKNKQDKTKRDKTRRDKTRQPNVSQHNTREHQDNHKMKTRQDKDNAKGKARQPFALSSLLLFSFSLLFFHLIQPQLLFSNPIASHLILILISYS